MGGGTSKVFVGVGGGGLVGLGGLVGAEEVGGFVLVGIPDLSNVGSLVLVGMPDLSLRVGVVVLTNAVWVAASFSVSASPLMSWGPRMGIEQAREIMRTETTKGIIFRTFMVSAFSIAKWHLAVKSWSEKLNPGWPDVLRKTDR